VRLYIPLWLSSFWSRLGLRCYHAHVIPISYESIGSSPGLVILLASYVIIPLFDECFFRGIALPALMHARSKPATTAQTAWKGKEKAPAGENEKKEAKKKKEQKVEDVGETPPDKAVPQQGCPPVVRVSLSICICLHIGVGRPRRDWGYTGAIGFCGV
jgi:hypothetical protein